MMRKLASSIFLLAWCGMPVAAFAQQPEVTVDVSVGGSVSTNPFLYADKGTAAAGNVGVRPLILWQDEVGQTAIEGDLRLAQYTNRYGTDLSGRIGVSSNRRLDEKTTLSLSSSYQSLRSAIQNNFLLAGQDPLNPSNDPIPVIPPVDTTIAGIRSRTQAASGSVGVAHVIDEVSSINAGVSLGASFVNDDIGFDYRNLSGHIGYERRFSERFALTATVQGGTVNYLGRGTGDSRIFTPQLGIRQQLTSRLIFVAGAGVSYVLTDVGTGKDAKRTSFSGNVGLCDRGQDQTFCLSASRSAQPTALGGVSSVTAVAANFDVVLSQKDRVSFAARYGRTDQNGNSGLPTQFRATDIIGVSGTYSRRLNDRMTFTVTPSYSKIYGDTQGRRGSNASLMVGVTVRFGKLG
ncbi:MAG: hypothetical protein JNM03_02730 [Sphingopyxis sp.]|uniref:hypothetical protein n=1 Tax=Sphingopyxis sp. TaxID=1908224 RepID=UPI001A36B2DD|nr:hypothetical protein [Sphingopyxis sp.]MBL9068889.1 hypothetical protein [Sphingopyxis sp.]